MNKKSLKDYRRKVQAVFQDPFAAFNPIYKVDHLLNTTIKKFRLAKSSSETRELLEKDFELLKLRPEILDKYPGELSGGERQRVMLCRAILPKPDLILADEPVSMLDTTIRIGVLEEMLKVRNQFGISFIYITHDLATASVLGGDVMIMYQGSVVEKGPIAKVLNKPAHPYTRLLVNSIPSPDPDQKSDFLDLSKMKAPTQEMGENEIAITHGCKFYERCGNNQESCRNERPSLLLFGDRLVRCPLSEKDF
jgi:peptide/nickel transport system ATP-binding protein